MQQQGERAKHQNQRQSDFVHGLQLSVYEINGAHLQHRGRHEHTRGHENIKQLVSPKKKGNWQKVQQQLHALNSSDAEFMQ